MVWYGIVWYGMMIAYGVGRGRGVVGVGRRHFPHLHQRDALTGPTDYRLGAAVRLPVLLLTQTHHEVNSPRMATCHREQRTAGGTQTHISRQVHV